MIYRKETEIGGRRLVLEVGRLANQADGAVWVQYGDTVILATAVAGDTPVEAIDFMPLSVEYRERAYAAGKIPGGFFKREGRPSEKEIVSARLIDRPIRPLFPEDFRNEVQVIIYVLSADQENDPDILGIIGASAALSISDIPFNGPIASVRVGKTADQYLLNPTFSQLEKSEMDMVIAGSKDSIIMVEGSANQIEEKDMVRALEFAHEELKKIIDLQEQLINDCGRPKRQYAPIIVPEELKVKIKELSFDKIQNAIQIQEKLIRKQAIESIITELQEALQEEFPESEFQISNVVADIQKEIMRKMIIEQSQRLDGRGLTDIRPITCEVGILPRAHGSALFTRGQTQSLAATTLGTKIDEQKIESLEGEFFKRYMLHYNFPPFSVGEVRPLRGPGRREIGHGCLAERALKLVIPPESDFPYTIRIVSDILESNGSSSMATVCAASLSLMDAGVPIKASVAGIAMGLIKENERVAILTDILGDEDHMGDMDFKVAGTSSGITAFQMDVKIPGISFDILRTALEQAKEARNVVLDTMNATLSKPRPEISKYAPRILTMKIPCEYIGTVIGPGGKTIREIIDKTGVTIDIEDNGSIVIASTNEAAAQEAKRLIEQLTAEPEVGKTYVGKVKRVLNFGAIVEIMPGREGLLHISEIEHHRINRVEDVLKVGDEVIVKLLKIEPDGKLDLSRRALLAKPTGRFEKSSSKSSHPSRRK
ncbi:polyribonucleotide nucleotidyltransferase [candidate division KSB1 bacterium]|nr:MAG: polyribonucleotide nucleotidyltransferase [candidate division KSB1 bacterium]HDI52473.1 polyribonucleotide nucleotidyltransferase [Bacteroidota bacterium]